MKEYKTEEEFLKDYNVKDFDQLSMTSDILLVSVSDQEQSNYRKNDKKMMSILLVKRNTFPYKDKWCLPGGFLNPKTETLEECAKRVLKKETNISNLYLEQLYTFDSLKRDPRTRVISTAYMALVDKKSIKDEINPNASWFDVILIENKNDIVEISLTNGLVDINFSFEKELKDKTTDRYAFKTINDKYLAFDHDIVILAGLERLKNKISYTDIVFNMMPKYFTLGELQQVYEVILGKELLDPAFRRMIKDKVKKTTKVRSDGGHRPSALFEYKKEHD